MIPFRFWRARSRHGVRSAPRPGCRNIERLEPRWLFANTLQVQIDPAITSISARDVQNLGIGFRFSDLTGTLTLTGDNLSTQSAGHGEMILGNVSMIDDISLSAAGSRGSLSVMKRGSLIPLGGFESSSAMSMINLSGTDLTGSAQFIAPPMLTLGNADGATINITQNIPLFTFNGGNFTGSMININSTLPAPAAKLHFGSVLDTQIFSDAYLSQAGFKSFTSSTPGSGGLTAAGAGSISVAGDYKADFKLNPSTSLKYSLDNFTIGQGASGTWNVPGSTKSLSARTFDSGFGGTFGTLYGLRAGTDFSGSLTAGSIGNATVGGKLNGANIDLTNPFAANSWNLWSLHVGNTIEDSTIRSNGNLGDISTMYTYYSQISAGISPSYVFGQVPTPTDYTSYSTIKSFFSDCPSHHSIHFVGSYVGAAYLDSIHLGNVQTSNSGLPFGMAGLQMDKVYFLLDSRPISLPSMNSTAALDAGLQKYGLTEASLGDYTLRFPM
jgi:hypothetical protein